ncbi:TPA: DUF3265 domain-containing protein [Vibrio vulnificus]|nr:DUF3265 domain-containing protein [Vibrio vulnificus]
MKFRSLRISKIYNKRFKRDSQRVALLLCVSLCDFGVFRNLCSELAAP